MDKVATSVCEKCGVHFQYSTARMREQAAPRRFCGRSCYYKSMAEDGRAIIRKPLDRSCARCGTPFRNKPSNSQRFCSVTCRATWQAALPYSEWRKKLSDNRANRATGERNGMFGVSPPHPKTLIPYSRLDGTLLRLRSSWEVEVARYLDRHGIAWLYEPQRFALDGATYVPDFYLPEDDCYWEVKGWFHTKAQAKIAAFREAFPEQTLVVLTKPAFQMIANDNRMAERECA